MKHRKPNRLKDYNYSQDNLYFVTSCVHDMVCCFGDVVVGTGRHLSSNAGRDLFTNARYGLSSKPNAEPPSTNNDDMGTDDTGTDITGTGRDLSSNAGRNLFTNAGHNLSSKPNGELPSTNNDDMGTGITGTGRDLSVPDLSLREPQMILNDYGKIAEHQWYWLAEQYPYVVLHEFMVMPNHMHGIIEINRDAVVTGRDLSLPKIKSLSELMGAYKTTVSKQIHLAGYAEFAWQRSFHDHIIRDEKSYERISNYIIDNPKTWDKDKFFNVGTGRDLSGK